MSARIAPAPERSGPRPYFDVGLRVDAYKLLPADYMVGTDGTALTTVLGSCVAACLRDPVLRIGGMNHFMLPDGDVGTGAPARYGSYAMELLINALLARGARRDRIEAKVFGGGNVLKSFTTQPVGTRNARFVLDYLATENIPVKSKDLGGIHPRKVAFFPETGRAMVRQLQHAHEDAVRAEENAYRERLVAAPATGSVELF
ncbi:chemoreceptor glutamine deamidase CheD [Coralloluteibacterium stylophorae]|uniref:Probable chemoreceptor glutamine deamidase CheD n=1 Tax=Coralloluteibacterium stylophorae TaxID=1776034 RepID=A0A8J7VSE8_9GAMM|nr:chemoreceptor glutamine deamidase CheD [Coralloluteibacterium stylophorae]MBS7457265.1 chemoreceptor glutamine deamidase CheD [Coralloluteibacterium stylophorae]